MKPSAVIALSAATGLAAGWFSLPLWHRPAEAPVAAGRLPLIQESGRARPGADVAQLIQSVHSAGGPTAQLGAALALADSLAPEDYRRLLEEVRHLPPNSSQTFFFRSLLRRWTETDPASAAEWCAGHASKQLGEVVRLWAGKDAAAAQRFTAGLPADARSKAVAGIAEALAESDPKAALAYIQRNGTSDSGYAMRSALNQLAGSDPRWLLENSDLLPGNLSRQAREAGAEAWARRDFNAALAWAAGQPDKDSMLSSVLSNAGDPATALAWLMAQDQKVQNKLSSSLSYALGRKHPETLLAALTNSEMPSGMRGNLLSGALYYAAIKDPAASAATLETLSSSLIRDHAANVMRPWLTQDPAAAKAWAESLPEGEARTSALATIAREESKPPASLPVSAKERVLTDLQANRFVDTTDVLRLAPQERLEILQTLNRPVDPNDSNPTAQHYASRIQDTLRNYYPEDYGAWLVSRGSDEQAQKDIPQHAAGWAAENAPAAAAWAATLPAGPAKLDAIARIARQWQALDSAGAAQWMQSLPPSEQSRARQALSE